MIYNIHHLIVAASAPFAPPLFGQKAGKPILVCHCLLVETDRGLVLIDTGLGTQDYLHTQQRLGSLLTKFGAIVPDIHLSAFHQIQRLGYSLDDVKHIFVSHLDFDHAGGISDFPNATVHVLHLNLMPLNLYHSKGKIVTKQNSLNITVTGTLLNRLMVKHGLICKKSRITFISG